MRAETRGIWNLSMSQSPVGSPSGVFPNRQWEAQPIFPTATMNPTILINRSHGLPLTASNSPAPMNAAMINQTANARTNFMGRIIATSTREASLDTSNTSKGPPRHLGGYGHAGEATIQKARSGLRRKRQRIPPGAQVQFWRGGLSGATPFHRHTVVKARRERLRIGRCLL